MYIYLYLITPLGGFPTCTRFPLFPRLLNQVSVVTCTRNSTTSLPPLYRSILHPLHLNPENVSHTHINLYLFHFTIRCVCVYVYIPTYYTARKAKVKLDRANFSPNFFFSTSFHSQSTLDSVQSYTIPFSFFYITQQSISNFMALVLIMYDVCFLTF